MDLHPLHVAVANAIESRLCGRAELIRDPACGGSQLISLFVGTRKGRDTRMCCVDLMVVQSHEVRAIIEIEESGFLPTKICGKFLQAAIATHFVHESASAAVVAYGDRVLFAQVLDASACLKPRTRKDMQAEIIANEIRSMLPLKRGSISDYRLYFVAGEHDCQQLEKVADAVVGALDAP